MTMKRLLSILVCLVAVVLAYGQQQYATITDIPYQTSTDDSYAAERCKLDFYYPVDTTGYPVVVWFHGGGLTGGSKYIPEELKNSGMGIIAVNYRLLPKAELPNCIDDAAAAVAWAFSNVAKYGGDVKKIYVAGHSAGGYLTDMIGLDKKWLNKYGVDADSIAGLFPFSGQVITHFAYRQSRGMKDTQPLIDEFAPLYYVRPDCPMIVIISGDRELEMLGRYEETAYFWRMLKVVGHKNVHMYELQGFGHGNMPGPGFTILKDYVVPRTFPNGFTPPNATSGGKQ